MTPSSSISKSMLWKLLERGGFLGCQFIIQIVMARILNPTDYGITSIMFIFTNIAQVFVQTGLSSALIQTKELSQDESSSVFWFNMLISVLLAGLLYLSAPFIERYYDFPSFSLPFRVLLIILPIGAINSVHISLLSRQMAFKSIMICSLISVIIGGGVGIGMAASGLGVWAITGQQIAVYFTNGIGLLIATRWKPKLILSLKKIGALINYGWKILASNIVETLYGDIVSLLIGKKYSPDMLAYYNRGKQYPNLIVGCVKEALQSVLLPAYSKQQDHPDFICQTMRRTLRISEMLVVPTMATLAIGAEPIVLLMLTEKWLLCVPYLQIACIFFAMLPITTVTLQGVSAIGRSDIFLKLSIAKRLIALLLVAVSVYLFDSVVAVAVVWALTGFLNIALNYKSIKQLFGYTAKMMASDLWPVLLASLVMLVAQISIRFLGLHSLITLLFQVAWGLLSYWLIIKALRYEGYADVIQLVKGMITKHSNKEM